mmetsp:Transcript_3177/g.3738  ORF Transcript_3177/g.3738 Transcript_3177/m.3738 type:complete len:701 (+) Transcript_3177:296-2398(+)
MTANDWTQTDVATSNVTTPDLFGGELFGDELIDMYNSDAVVGSNSDISSEIPNLLPQAPNTYDIPTTKISPESNNHISLNHPGSQVALAAAAIDDGLGSFRPSTSFSDLASLLPETTPCSVPSSTAVSMQLVTAPTPKVDISLNTNRITALSACGTNTPDLGQKKRIAGVKRANNVVRRTPAKVAKTANSTTLANVGSSAGQAALQLRQEQQAIQQVGHAENTPNPLSIGAGTNVVTGIMGVINSPPCLNPAVVSPTSTDSITSEAAAAAAAAVVAAAAVPVPPPAPSSGTTTEADFKSVAQAAVTNLILNAGTSKNEHGNVSSIENKKVDTSTSHIKALTSSNWVAACSGGVPTANTVVVAGVDSKANRARRQNLTPDERARQNRDRNREHARNTRLRKKAYVEELKRTLTELVSQRDTADLEKRHSAQRELEQREVRFRVMEEFLKLRGRNETSYARWVAILEDNFSFTLPITDYRKTIEKEEDSCNGLRSEQLLHGASEAMQDAEYLASFLQTLGNATLTDVPKPPVTLIYECDRKNFFMDGCNGVLVWSATTIGAVAEGAPMELTLKGNMRANFSPASNKLISAEVIFDTGNIATQLQFLDSPKLEHNHEEIIKCEIDAAAAAQAVANEADALLDSLQMPQLGSAVPSAITVMPSTGLVGMNSTAVSITSSDKGDLSDDSLDGVLPSAQTVVVTQG